MSISVSKVVRDPVRCSASPQIAQMEEIEDIPWRRSRICDPRRCRCRIGRGGSTGFPSRRTVISVPFLQLDEFRLVRAAGTADPRGVVFQIAQKRGLAEAGDVGLLVGDGRRGRDAGVLGLREDLAGDGAGGKGVRASGGDQTDVLSECGCREEQKERGEENEENGAPIDPS